MSSSLSEVTTQVKVNSKNDPGYGYVVVIYGLYMGSIMAVVTAPIGALIAHYRLGRGASWLDSHLQFLIRTFWIGILALGAGLLLWRVNAMANLPPVYAWSFGYLFFTLGIIWAMARCGVGIHRLTSRLPIDQPKSWLFGNRIRWRN